MGIPWRPLRDFLVRRRVRISAIAFILLIAEDVVHGVRPHGLLDWHDAKSMVGLGLVLGGLGLRSWAAGVCRKGAELTTRGPYQLMRHPLYVGSFLLMIGFCTLIDDPENVWFVLGPLSALYLLGVGSEEQTLAGRFGEDWRRYAESTPRFIPRRIYSQEMRHWKLATWLRNREYRTLSAVCAGLLAVEVWHLR